MANKDISNKDLDSLDDFDWPDFDFEGIDGAGSDNDDSRKPAKIAKSALKAGAKTITDPKVIEKTLGRVLPAHYGKGVDPAFESMRQLKGLYDTTYSELADTTREMRKSIGKLAPTMKGKVPDKVYSLLERMGITEDYYQAKSKKQEREEAVGSRVEEIFGAIAKGNKENREQATVERMIAKAQANKRFATTTQLLSSIDNSLNLSRDYQDRVDSRWKRMMLESSLTSQYLLSDFIETSTKAQEDMITRLGSIVKNTALPEAQKIRDSEEFSRLSKQRMLGRVSEGLFGGTADYLGKTFTNLRENFQGALKTKMQGLRRNMRDAADLAGEMSEMSGQTDTAETIFQLAFGIGADWAGNKWGGKAGDALSKIQGFNKHQGRVEDWLESGGRKLNEQAHRRDNDYSIMGWLKDLGRGALHKKTLNGAIKDDIVQNGHMPDNFNRMTNRALIEIIPGLLARIHHSLEKTRTGDPNTPMIRYSMQTGTFTDMSKTLKEAKSRIATDFAVNRNRTGLDEIIKDIDPDGKLGQKERAALQRHMTEINMRHFSFSPENMVRRNEIYGTKDADVRKNLQNFMASRYSLGMDSKFDEQNLEAVEARNRHSRMVNSYGNAFQDPTGLVNQMIEEGYREELIQLGILDISGGMPRVNFSKAIDFYLGLVEEGEIDPAGAGAGQPPRLGGPTAEGGPGRKRRRRRRGGKKPSLTPESARPKSSGTIRVAPNRVRIGAPSSQGGRLNLRGVNPRAPMIRQAPNRIRLGGSGFVGPRRPMGNEAIDYDRLEEIFQNLPPSYISGGSNRSYPTEAEVQTHDRLDALIAATQQSAHEASEQRGWLNLMVEEIMDITTDGRLMANILSGCGCGEGDAQAPMKAVGGWRGKLSRLKDAAGRARSKAMPWVDRGITAGKSALDFGRKRLDSIRTRARGILSTGRDLATNAGSTVADWARGRMDRARDIYVKGLDMPVLQANLLRAGKYRDQITGDIITKISDIKNAVVDEDGNVVLSIEQIRKGLVDSHGGQVLLKGFNWALDKAGAIKDGVMGRFGRLGDMAKSGLNWAMDKLTRLNDVYVKGEDKPRLLAFMVRNGAYIDKTTNKVISKLSDIKGDVVDLQGNLVMAAEDMKKGLVDRWGQELKVGFAGVVQGAKAHLKQAGNYVGQKWRSLKGMVSKQWAKLTGMFSKGGKGGIKAALADLDGTPESVQKAQLQIQVQILENLIEMNPGRRKRTAGDPEGDGTRAGSWMDQAKGRAASLLEKGKAKAALAGGGLMGLLSGAGAAGKDLLAKLFGKKDKREEEEEDDDDGFGLSDAADIADIADSVRGRGKGGRGARGRGKVGRLGKAWNWMKGKAGKGLGRIAQSRAGQFVAQRGGQFLATNAARVGLTSAATALSGMSIGGMLTAAGTGLAALLASPVVLGALAVGAVAGIAYGAWKLYDSMKDRPIQKFRLAQYGWDLEDSSNAKAYLAFEENIMGHVKMSGGKPTLEIDDEQLQEAAEPFDIDFSKSSMKLKLFGEWLEGRFKPVFFANIEAMAKVGDWKKLPSADDDLADDKKSEFLDAVRMTKGLMNSYRSSASPWGTEKRSLIDTDKIMALYKDAKDKADKAKEKGGFLSSLGSLAMKATPVGWLLQTDTARDIGAGIKSALGFGPPPVAKGTNLQQYNSDPNNPNAKLYPGTSVDALRSVRFKTYGLEEMDRNGVRALVELEQAMLPFVRATSNGEAVFRGTVDDLLDSCGAYFGVGEIGSDSWAQFVAWFESRFIPVYLKHYGFVKKLYPNVDPGEAHKELEADDQLDLAMTLVATTSVYQGKTMPVWDIPLGPLIGAKPNTNKGSVDGNIAALKDGLTQKRLDEESGKAGQVVGKTSESTGGVFDKLKSFFGFGGDEKKTSAENPAYRQFMSQNQGSNSSTTPKSSVGSYSGFGATGDPQQQGAGGAMNVPAGQEVVLNHPGGGAKGDINMIPMPKGLQGYEEHKETIAAAAAMTGFPADLMATVIAAESNFTSKVKASTSAAQGLGQFVPGTWDGMMKKYAKQYGIAPGTPATDPRANALFTALYMRDNAEEFEKTMGRKATDVDIYMMHFLGAGGYRTFLRNPGVAGGALYPSFEAANPTIFRKDKGRGPQRTTNEIIAVMAKKVDDNRKLYGGKMSQFASTYKLGGQGGAAAQVASSDTGGVGAASAPPPEAMADAGQQPTPGQGTTPAQPGTPGATTASAQGLAPEPGVNVTALREAANANSDIAKAPVSQGEATAQPVLYSQRGGGAADNPTPPPSNQQQRAAASSAQSTVSSDIQQANTKAAAEIQQKQLDTQIAMDQKLGRLVQLFETMQKQAGGSQGPTSTPIPKGPMSMDKTGRYKF